MSNAGRELPPKLKRFFKVDTVDEMWSYVLKEGNSVLRYRRHYVGRLPSGPRCAHCHTPFAGPGGFFFRVFRGVEKSKKNPRFCNGCHSFASDFPGGAEIELSMLFVDVRGSTTLAENMSTTEFSALMNRFYTATIDVLVKADAFIDKLVGDEVTALFIPGFAGSSHASKAVVAGQELLKVTGHDRSEGPWVPVGVGVHTGEAWVGSIAGAGDEAADFTALGDNVNIAARLASSARAGEVLASESAMRAGGFSTETLEKRELSLKGKSQTVAVRVLGTNSSLA